MKTRLLQSVAALLFSQALAAGGRAEDAPSLQEIFDHLGSENYAIREKASAELWRRGDESAELLKTGASSDDPEIARRCRDLIRKIDLGITPDSPPEVIALVSGYDKGGPSERLRAMRSLHALKAWRPMMKLYATEKDPGLLEDLSREMQGVPEEAARVLLAAEPSRPEEAIACLKTGRPGPAEWLAIASIRRSLGRLDQELGDAVADGSPDGPVRRYAALAVSGRVKDAAAAADVAGLASAAVRLHALDGDPMPWIRARDDSSEGLAEYRTWVAKQWSSPALDASPSLFAEMAADEDGNRSAAGVALLLLTRDYEGVARTLAKQRPLQAFLYFEGSERPDEALAVVGLDPAAPDYKAWAAGRFKAIAARSQGFEAGRLELCALAGFLAEHGLGKELDEAFIPGMRDLMATDEDSFIQFCAALASGASGSSTAAVKHPPLGPVLALLPEYAKGDDGRWSAALEAIWGDQSAVLPLWGWLAELDPSLDRAQRLRRAVMLLDMPEPSEVRAVLKKAWHSYQRSDAAGRPPRLLVLNYLAQKTSDPQDYLKVIDTVMARESQPGEEVRFQHGLFLQLAGKGAEAVKAWQEQVKVEPAAPVLHACLSAALARTGDAEGAAREEALASELCLADFLQQSQCASAFASAGEVETSQRWTRRAALECSPGNAGFPSLEEIQRTALESGDWKLAASLGEVLAADSLARVSEGDISTVEFLKIRVDADIALALSKAQENPAFALQLLESVHSSKSAAGALADDFYPGLRAAGFNHQHDEWFEASWQEFQALARKFPDADNMLNSMAWACARANRHLDEAEGMLHHALEIRPSESNYLDTMGEIWFDRRDREQAASWSEKSNGFRPLSDVLLAQLHRFRTGPFPLP